MAHISLGGEEGLVTTRLTATGLAYTGACLICWISCHPDQSDFEIGISDGVATGTTKWSVQERHCNFSKPMKMETGIYVEKLDHVSSITIGYAKVIT